MGARQSHSVPNSPVGATIGVRRRIEATIEAEEELEQEGVQAFRIPEGREAPATGSRWAWATGGGRPQARAPIPEVPPAPRAFPRFSPLSSETATPQTESRPNSSSCAGTWRNSYSSEVDDTCSEASLGSSTTGGVRLPSSGLAELKLSQARQKSNEVMEALRMELRGFGAAVALRYASWPEGAVVEVALPPEPGLGNGRSTVFARWVCFDASSNSCEVRLRDGSTRTVPVCRVRRATGTGATSNVAGTVDVLRHTRPRSPEMLH